MAKLSEEEKRELECWRIEVLPLWRVNDDGGPEIGNYQWWVDVYRGSRLIAGLGLESFDEAYKLAMSLSFRKEQSPIPHKPIPPRQVGMMLSHRALKAHHKNLVELFESGLEDG